jgi:hypothetical protein
MSEVHGARIECGIPYHPSFRIGDGALIVEFDQPTGGGPLPVAVITPGDAIAKSNQAVDAAMETIHEMSERFLNAIEGLATPPSEVELEFGISFQMEGGAIVVKSTAGASLTVKLTWKK